MMDNFLELKNLEEFYSQNQDSIIFAFLANEYIKAGNYAKAREVAEKGIRKYPTYAYGYFVLGLAFYHLNDLKRAKKQLELSVTYDEKNPRAWKLIGEINENLNLSLNAAESKLHYFLLDPFNKDAVDKFQEEEMLQFDEFENDQSLDFDSEFDRDKEFPEEEQELDLLENEAGIDDLFDTETKESEEIDITQKVDEVFKETLGEMTIEREEKKVEESLFDDVFEDFDLEETVSEEPQEKPQEKLPQKDLPKEEEEPEFIDFGADFDDFYPEPGIEEEDLDEETEALKEEEEEEFDFSNMLFDESTVEDTEEKDTEEKASEAEELRELEDLEEEDITAEEKESPESDELLSYRSMVDEILSEKEEETGEESEEAEIEEKPAITLSEAMEAAEEEIMPPEPPVETKPVSPAITPSRTDGVTRFGKPPILSPTLGEIYISQGRFEEALDVFKQLRDKDPENQRFQKKIKDIQMMLDRQRSL